MSEQEASEKRKPRQRRKPRTRTPSALPNPKSVKWVEWAPWDTDEDEAPDLGHDDKPPS